MVIPIWKDYKVDLGTTDGIAFTIYDKNDNTGNVIYSGKAYIKPGDTHAFVKINDICGDYLHQALVSGEVPIRHTFSVYAGATKKAEVEFFLCRDYDTDDQASLEYYPSRPITGRIQDGTPLAFTKYSAQSQGVDLNYGSFDTSLSVSSLVRNYVFMGPTGFDSVKISPIVNGIVQESLGFQLRIIPRCHRYQLYYQNALGGLDCLVIEGKVVMKDRYKRTLINKAYDNNVTLVAPAQFAIREAGSEVVANDITRTWELHTGWLTDAEASRMGHLLGSPLVYLFDCVTNVFQPVVITNADCPYKTYRNDGMIDFAINVQLAETLKR